MEGQKNEKTKVSMPSRAKALFLLGVLHTDLRGIKLGSTRMHKEVKTEKGVITVSPNIPDEKKRKLVAFELSKLIGDFDFYHDEFEKKS